MRAIDLVCRGMNPYRRSRRAFTASNDRRISAGDEEAVNFDSPDPARIQDVFMQRPPLEVTVTCMYTPSAYSLAPPTAAPTERMTPPRLW
jgi:hypothetical protein